MSNLNLVNFDRTHNNDQIDTAIQQALSSFDPHEQQLRAHQDKGSVPIDPSIGSVTDKAVAAAAANAATFARNTAQAAVNSSKIPGQRQQQSGPKISKPRVNKPGQKFGAKKKSWVWNWFIQDLEDCNLATCDFCGKSIRRLSSDKGSPKKLGEHLKTHKIDRQTVNSRRESMIQQPPNNENRPFFNTLNGPNNTIYKPQPIQQQQDSEAPTSAEPQDEQDDLDHTLFDQSPYSRTKFQKEVMRFLSENKLPQNIVQSHSFKQLVYSLKPSAVNDLNDLNSMYQEVFQSADKVMNVVGDQQGSQHPHPHQHDHQRQHEVGHESQSEEEDRGDPKIANVDDLNDGWV
ncbi:CYFA0S01e16006g1_1 [Cyberlindnera fabianii]|uniref:CYFA0S01e16006g1_1 n=1 Tax=Cyberlindnera fabianii TaxID=36022 RepID=A0A061AJG1_CYBFA|nr:CYFA0S01e16006g1_1 [Cyberlindnera fabianii]